jgi:acetylornithine deacetylase/succinyl-diaminopimelate desuccinylase-like protein
MDGFVWGRGALDMKGGVAMLLAAFLKASAEKIPLPGDVLFAAVADEEAGGEFGVRYLVDEHPDIFKGVRYAFGEFGGFNFSISGKRFYPIMVAEKQTCAIKATFTGPAGHGSLPVHGGAMARLARALHLLDTHQLPVHITPSVRLMVGSLAKNLAGPSRLVIRLLLNPPLTNLILKMLGDQAGLFTPLLHNTVSPTILQASDKVNVIPGEVNLGLDGRLVPGAKPEDIIRELHSLLGKDVQFEVIQAIPGPAAPDLGLFDTLGGILRTLDPTGIPLPYVLSGATDARFLSKLGIQTYGFIPLQLPDDFNFANTIHAADERVPVAALDFGVKAIFESLRKFK